MSEIFETVVILSVFGFAMTALILLLKPVTSKKLPAKWQYWVWVLVLVAMVVPVYRMVPEKEAEKIAVYTENIAVQPFIASGSDFVTQENIVPEYKPSEKSMPDIMDALPIIWVGGIFIYICVVSVSYGIYIFRKRKCSVLISYSVEFERAKAKLNIKRKIRLKVCEGISSPMLVGVVFPTVYIPGEDMENVQMVFLHELMHFKRKDLLIKWFAIIVNSVHWFNPFAYIICRNLSEACEVCCDMAVTKKMSLEERKTYMKTILNLAG